MGIRAMIAGMNNWAPEIITTLYRPPLQEIARELRKPIW